MASELLRIKNCPKFFLSFSQENIKPKSILRTFENRGPGFDFDHITAVDMSFCTFLRNVIQIGLASARQKKMTSCRFH